MPKWKFLGSSCSKVGLVPEARCEDAVLSSEARDGTGLRVGEGGNVGTVVVVVTVLISCALCLESLVC